MAIKLQYLANLQRLHPIKVKQALSTAGKRVGNLCGRIVKDWTLSTMGILGVSGVSIAVVGTLLSSAILIAASVVLLSIALFLGMFRVYTLKPKKDFEYAVEDLNQVNKELGNSTEKLGINIENLNTTKSEFKESILQANEAGDEIKIVLEDNNKDLKETTEELVETTNKLNLIVGVYEEVRELFENFSEDLIKYEENNGNLSSTVSRIQHLLVSQDDLFSKTEQFQQTVQALSENRKQVESLNRSFADTSSQMREDRKIMDHHLENLEQNTNDLNHIGDRFLNGSVSLSESVLQLGSLLKEFHEAVDGLSDSESETY